MPSTCHGGDKTTNNYSLVVSGESGKTLGYDLNGNCTNVSMPGTNICYEWDAEDRLVAINTYVTNTATLQRSEFAYDGFDRWAQIIEKTNGVTGSTSRFIWCGGSSPCQERDGGNNVQKRFFDEGEQIAGNNYYFVRDRLGSVQEMVDADDFVRAQYEYDPYGQQTQVGQETQTASYIPSDFGFAGYYQHAPSGLYLTEYRAYDPSSGRWLNRDPIGENGGLNLYDYVGNEPVNFYDPYGLWSWTGALGGTGAVIGGVAAAGISVVVDAGTIGINVAGTPAEIAGGATLGAAAGAYLGHLLDPKPFAQPKGPTVCNKLEDKAPGPPTSEDGYTAPKRGPGSDGEPVRNPNGPGYGWLADDGGVWVPTGEGPLAHGGPHWDVQYPWRRL